jgi:hypothetical protein
LLYQAIDIFFTIFHTALILFNLFGWIWRKTRVANLVTLLLTGGSWFILGLFYVMGYCPLTDWHFQVLRKMGKTGLPNSYTEYLAERLVGHDFSTGLVNQLTLWGFVAALVLSVTLNARDRIKKRK